MCIENGRHALVLGAGASGAAATRFLLSRGWRVTTADSREAPSEGPVFALGDLADGAEGLTLHFGGLPKALLDDTVDLVVMSPGLSPMHSAAAGIVREAQSRGIEVVGEIELFARELDRLKKFRKYDPVVIGITGTNGKTTTTTIVGLMAAAGGKSVCVAGNIGPNAISELDARIKENKLPQVWVLELSSFQLETTSTLKCTAAAFLNLTEDHVDWHGSLDAYAAAKTRIFSENTARVVNRDDIVTLRAADNRTRTFGDNDPTEPGQWGITTDMGVQWLSRIELAEQTTSKRAILASEPPQKTLLMPVDALRIHGRHNAMNALAALALIEAAGLDLAAALKVLKTYQGEPHRVQSVLCVGEIEFIDDSKGTNVGAVIAALKGLGADGRKCALVMGGDGKGQDFSPLKDAVNAYARSVVLIGRDGPLIGKALEGSLVPVTDAGRDFEAAVRLSYASAKAGDAVLLSPACASWDMFDNYAQRSALFVKVAQKIADEVNLQKDPQA